MNREHVTGRSPADDEAWLPAVVIPTFQRRDLVGRAISSVLSQQLPPREVIVVDDGSTDGTEEVVRGFPEVRYLRQPNRGASVARNLGVSSTSAEWVAFLDSDDVWLPGHLARMSEAIQGTRARADVYFADALVAHRGGRDSWFARCGFDVADEYQISGDAFGWAMTPWQPMFLQASVIRRQAWSAVGGLREELPTREDTHLFFRLALHGKACAVNAVGVEVTADSPADIRLTEVHAIDGGVYTAATVSLYEDILRRSRDVAPAHQKELRRRLSTAYLLMARAHARDSRRLRAVRSAASAFTCCPSAVIERGFSRLREEPRAEAR